MKPTTVSLPEKARLFESYLCDGCGESTGEAWITQVNGKKLCPDCAAKY